MIFSSSRRQQLDSVYVFEKTIIVILELSIARMCSSSFIPSCGFSLLIKVLTWESEKAEWRWETNFLQISSPPKLMNTSYMNWGSDFKKDEDDDEEEEANSIKGIEVNSSKAKQ